MHFDLTLKTEYYCKLHWEQNQTHWEIFFEIQV